MSTAPDRPTPTASDRPTSESTRSRLLTAALAVFSSSSFDGVSIRTVERKAKVERGLVAYHFGSKQRLWTAAVESIFDAFIEELEALSIALRDVAVEERARAMRKSFVRFNARNPEWFRLMIMEGLVRSERTELLESKLRKTREIYREMLNFRGDDRMEDLIALFIVLGSSAAPFIMPALREPSFSVLGEGVDSRDEDFVEAYADAVARLPLQRQGASEVAVASLDIDR